MSESNIESLLLTPKENKLVAQTLGKGRKSLATGVAQVHLALPSDRTKWTKIGTGVVCLVKDKHEKSFFIRMLDLKEKAIVWEQELYKQFKYRAVSKYFQTFFAHDCRAGINFANSEEAALFRAAIMERVNVFKKKREEMRQRKMAAHQQQQQQQQMQNFQMSQMQNFYRMQSLMLMQMRSPGVQNSQRAQLQAMFNSMPPETKQAFLANLSRGPSALMQPFPSNMSGMQLANQGQPNVMPTPSQMQSFPSSSRDRPQMVQPPAPPPTTPAASTPQAPTPPSLSDLAIEDLEDTGSAPQTPPPPPPPAAPSAPPPPPPPSAAPPPPGLKSSNASSSEPRAPAPPAGDRSGLLQSIQAGAKLRKVGESEPPVRKIPKVESGMRGALARALDSRAKVLGDDDSDEEDEWDDDDDDDWSD